jgi:DNA-binding transcriptional ArsR family regulator
MAKSYGKSKGRGDSVKSFAGISREVMKHPDYQNLSGGAVKLLNQLAYQYRGHNNGDLTAAYSVLKTFGFKSKDTISRAIKELLEAGIVIRTREGKFINPGGVCALYALTWLAIDECPGKNLTADPATTPPRNFKQEINRMPSPASGLGSSLKSGRQRVRDKHGKYSSSLKSGRLVAVT